MDRTPKEAPGGFAAHERMTPSDRVVRLLGGLALAGATALLATALAAAHEASFRSTATIHFYDAANPSSGPSKCDDPSENKDCFYGRVRSKRAACERDRTIQVFDRSPPSPMKARALGGDPPALVGETTSDADGRWILIVDNPGTHTFFARVSRRPIPRPGHTHVCRRAVSDDLKVNSDFG